MKIRGQLNTSVVVEGRGGRVTQLDDNSSRWGIEGGAGGGGKDCVQKRLCARATLFARRESSIIDVIKKLQPIAFDDGNL